MNTVKRWLVRMPNARPPYGESVSSLLLLRRIGALSPKDFRFGALCHRQKDKDFVGASGMAGKGNMTGGRLAV